MHYEIFAKSPGELAMVSTGNSVDTLNDAEIEAREMFGNDTFFRYGGEMVWDGLLRGDLVCRIYGLTGHTEERRDQIMDDLSARYAESRATRGDE